MNKKRVTETTFNLITEYARIHPELTQSEIGKDCGGWSNEIVSRVLICGGSWAKYEENKRKHNERYKANGEKSNGNDTPRTMIVSFDQMKALAKDVDNIRNNIELLVQIGIQLLEIWKEG